MIGFAKRKAGKISNPRIWHNYRDFDISLLEDIG
jgi:hypothetical protein